MTIECIKCGKDTADRTVFEKYHTSWHCRSCDTDFKITLRGVYIWQEGKGWLKHEEEAQ